MVLARLASRISGCSCCILSSIGRIDLPDDGGRTIVSFSGISSSFKMALVFRPGDTFTEPCDLGQDGFSSGDPCKGASLGIVVFYKTVDFANQFLDVGEGATSNCLLGNQSKPAFHLIDPGCVSRGVMHVKTRTDSQPLRHKLDATRKQVCGRIAKSGDDRWVYVTPAEQHSRPQAGCGCLFPLFPLPIRLPTALNPGKRLSPAIPLSTTRVTQ